MILDTMTAFSAAQSLAVGTGDTVSTNTLDTGVAQDEGIGKDTTLHVRTPAAVTSGGAGTLQLVLQTDTAPNFATALTEFPLTSALALAAMGANALLYRGRLPIGLKRYLRIVYRVAGAALTGGSISAGLLIGADLQASYAKNYTIS